MSEDASNNVARETLRLAQRVAVLMADLSEVNGEIREIDARIVKLLAESGRDEITTKLPGQKMHAGNGE